MESSKLEASASEQQQDYVAHVFVSLEMKNYEL